MDNTVFSTWPIFIFWDRIYVLKLEHCSLGWLCVTRSGWVERRLWGRVTSSAFPSQQSCQWTGRGRKGLWFALWDPNELRSVLQEIRAFALHVWFFAPELRRKMWSVNAVIWLCNATDCSGSGKVTYLLGWHDWPMSADVWRQASFSSAAAQLCPWAVLVPVPKTSDFYLPISAYFLCPEKFPIRFSKTRLVQYWYTDPWSFFQLKAK